LTTAGQIVFDVFVVDKFAAIGGGESLFYFLEEPFVVVDQALDGFHDQGLAVTALFGGKAGELFLQVGIQSYFHGFSVEMQGNIVNIENPFAGLAQS
jgi:hypothetical protein